MFSNCKQNSHTYKSGKSIKVWEIWEKDESDSI